MKDLSVLILNWNTRGMLLDCIESIINRTSGIDYEIVVVDNASTDGSVAAVRERYSDIKLVVNERNEGFARGNNIGMEYCSGKFICLSNTDILVLDSVLNRMLSYLEENPSVAVLLPRCLDGESKLRRCCREFPSLRNQLCEALFLDRLPPQTGWLRGRSLPEHYYEQTRTVDTVPCCFTMIRRAAMDQVGKLDEDFYFYGEDIDWCRRFKKAGWDVVYFADSSVIHFGGSSTADAPARYLIEKIKSTLIYWRKHHSALSYNSLILITLMRYAMRSFGYFVQAHTPRGQQLNARSRSASYFDVVKWLARNSHRVRGSGGAAAEGDG